MRLCPTNVNNYMWAVLIIGYVHVVVTILFLILYKPKLVMMPQAKVLRPPLPTIAPVPMYTMNTTIGNGTFLNNTTIRMV